MFCHTLRRRPSYVSAISTICSAAGLSLRESQLDTHDLAIPLDAALDPRTGIVRSSTYLRVLLLSPSIASHPTWEATLQRIHRFAHLSVEPAAVVFLLRVPRDTRFQSARQLADEGINSGGDDGAGGVFAYTKLQTELMSRTDIPYIPILPLSTPEGLPDLLKKHVTILTHPPAHSPHSATSLDLLQLCTLHQPLPPLTASYISDTFGSLRDVATAMTLAPGALSSSSDVLGESASRCKIRSLENLIGSEQLRPLVAFWQGEFEIAP